LARGYAANAAFVCEMVMTFFSLLLILRDARASSPAFRGTLVRSSAPHGMARASR